MSVVHAQNNKGTQHSATHTARAGKYRHNSHSSAAAATTAAAHPCPQCQARMEPAPSRYRYGASRIRQAVSSKSITAPHSIVRGPTVGDTSIITCEPTPNIRANNGVHSCSIAERTEI